MCNGINLDEVNRDDVASHSDAIQSPEISACKKRLIGYNSTSNLKNNNSYLARENTTKINSIKKNEADPIIMKTLDGCDSHIENSFEKRNFEPKIKIEAEFFDYDLGHNRLQRVLRAYANFDGEVGYTQGMNFIVAGLIYCLNPNNDKESIDGT